MGPMLWQKPFAGDCSNHLAVDQLGYAQEQAHQPLLPRQFGCGEPSAAELDNHNLRNEGRAPDNYEHPIRREVLEDVALAVHLSTIDLVEEGHHDERIEDDGEMLCCRGEELRVDPTRDAEK